MGICKNKFRIEEILIKLCVFVPSAILPFGFVCGVIISGLGMADYIQRYSPSNPYFATTSQGSMVPKDSVYMMVCVMLLVLSVVGCHCYSCTVLYKLREPYWGNRNRAWRRDREESTDVSFGRNFHYPSTHSGRPTTPSNSTRVVTWNENDLLVSNYYC